MSAYGAPFARGGYRAVNPYQLHVFASRNNTILTLTAVAPSSPLARPVAWVSAGSAGYKGANRGTYDAGVECSLQMFKKIQDLVSPPILPGGQKLKAVAPVPTELELVWKGFGQGRDAVFRTLMGGEGEGVRYLVKRVTDAVRSISLLPRTIADEHA